jgi:hypothetical protein
VREYCNYGATYYISQCTYLNIGLLEAPREYILHGPLLGIYWLSSAPVLASVYLVATLVQRMLFIALRTAAQVSPNVFLPSGWLLANVQVNITLQYTVHSIHFYPSWALTD